RRPCRAAVSRWSNGSGRILLLFVAVFRTHVTIREIDGERRPPSRFALHVDLATEEARDLAADGEAEASPAILAAGGPVRLLERFEDDLLLVLGNADPGIAHGEGDHPIRAVERLVGESLAIARRGDAQLHPALRGELD